MIGETSSMVCGAFRPTDQRGLHVGTYTIGDRAVLLRSCADRSLYFLRFRKIRIDLERPVGVLVRLIALAQHKLGPSDFGKGHGVGDRLLRRLVEGLLQLRLGRW